MVIPVDSEGQEYYSTQSLTALKSQFSQTVVFLAGQVLE